MKKFKEFIIFDVWCKFSESVNIFQWTTEGNVSLPSLDFPFLEKWLIEVAARHKMLVGDINYIFCDDRTILKVNREFLNHDYFTDIITFDRSGRGIVRGDIYLSLDTVESNSEQLNQEYGTELLRVIVHGLLHLCGINDKGPGEREVMELEENKALELYISMT